MYLLLVSSKEQNMVKQYNQILACKTLNDCIFYIKRLLSLCKESMGNLLVNTNIGNFILFRTLISHESDVVVSPRGKINM